MALNTPPIFPSPFTDMFGAVAHHQYFGPCADFEMGMMNCLEAYGAQLGKVKCKDLIDDFYECHNQTKQIAREDAMLKERDNQVSRGERAKKDRYAPPPKVDSY